MFPHQNNMRDRRVGQPPMAPQHLMGMPQQGPGVIMPMQPISQIMTPAHSMLNQNISSYVTTPQLPQKSYPTNQGFYTKQGINRNKSYRKEYSTTKFTVSYNVNDHSNHHRTTFSHSQYTNSSNSFSAYHRNYNGHYSANVNRGGYRNFINSHEVTNRSKREFKKDESTRNVGNSQECAAIPSNYVTAPKEKTPMCLVNELARFNKITHQYRLTNEKGPPHRKSFTVTLALGKEEYTAEGPSIKKAQHAAAAEALAKTSFIHPPQKSNRNTHNSKTNVTPTVELNALAMKRGEPAIYKLVESTQQGFNSFNRRVPYTRGFGGRGRNGYFSRIARMPVKLFTQRQNFTVSLKVGRFEFYGEGPTPQIARHDAAAKALQQLRILPVPDENTCPVQNNNNNNTVEISEDSIKSPISIVHEIGLKRDMTVLFEVISERGPPHMKTFITRCTVGTFTTTGEGNGKKMSKKKAAENMLVELKKLPSMSPSLSGASLNPYRLKRKMNQSKKKSRNLIKIVPESSLETISNDDLNPISRLLQIQQAKKEKEPIFTLLEEKDKRMGKEFLMEVSFGRHTATGSGASKKLAKRAAAQKLLNSLDYSDVENKDKSAFNAQENSQDVGKDKAAFVDDEKSQDINSGGSAGRQVKPGLYVMSSDQQCSSNEPFNMEMTATIARELLKSGNSPTADALLQQSAAAKTVLLTGQQESIRPKDQLMSIAELLNFQVHFSDFPKGNHSEFLSLVTMSTDPSHVCHGSGQTIEESQDQAALTALRALSEMGLDQTAAQELSQNGKVLAAINK